MRLDNVLPKTICEQFPDSVNGKEITAVVCDSRAVTEGCVFFALEGSQKNGAQFVTEAIKRGAKVIIETGVAGYKYDNAILYIYLRQPKGVLRYAVDQFYGHPSSQVKCCGVTGTNGKTTITYLIRSIFKAASLSCGIMGTIQHIIGDEEIEAKNTTPGVVDIQKYLAQMRDAKMDYCAMEVSSHGLDQGRVDLIEFRQAVFTNLTQDHLDYHKTEEEYFLAKARLFTALAPEAFAVINGDDAYGKRLGAMTKAKVVYYGIDQVCDVCAKDIEMSVNGSRFTVCYPAGKFNLETFLIGKHNIYNILAAVSVALNAGLKMAAIQLGVKNCALVNGRLEKVVCSKEYSIFIDYAHTDDALKNVITALRRVSQGRIIVVFGCGGDRDRTKRPKMGKVVCELADYAFVTSDNPRSENPEQIIEEIKKGFSKNNYGVAVDRTDAIRQALAMAKSQDVILLAGKGHETYQIFKDRTIDYDERIIVKEILNAYS